MDRSAYRERVSLAERDQPVFQEHLARYEFVAPMASGKVVLDAASGTGYGTAFLAQTARSVVGVDIAREAVALSRRHFSRSNLRFMQMDCVRLGFATAVFDLVCAFEMIEHIVDYSGALREITRVLRPGGALVLSTPNRQPERPVPPANPYHVREFSSTELATLLCGFFSHVELFSQRGNRKVQAVRYGTPLKQGLSWLDPMGLRRLLPGPLYRGLHRLIRSPLPQDLRPSDYPVAREGVETADFLVAVCING